MRKKIFSALMLVAFFAATSSTLVSCKDYDEEISAVNTRIDNLDEDLSDDIAALETQLNTAKTQLQAAIDANSILINSLQDKHDADVATLNSKIAENNQKIVDLTARVAALESAMTAAQTAIQNLADTKADKTALDAAIADANAVHAALSGDITKLQNADNDIIAAYKAADSALETAIRAAIEAGDKELAAAYAAADKNLQTQIDANLAAIKALQDFQTAQEAINAAQQATNAAQEANNATQQAAIGENATAISNLAEKEAQDIQTLNESLTAFKSEVAEKYATKVALAEGMEKVNNDINDVNDKINLINVLISKRLTSIVFAPNKYIDGVECIDFASIKYKTWGKADEAKKAEKEAFLRDFPTDKNYSGDNGIAKPDSFLIDNGTTTATYYVNPTGVKTENIASLEYLQNYATNYLTRQDNVKDGIVLKIAGYEVANGKLTVKLTKNAGQAASKNQINNGNKDFTIVSLKANIAKEQLAEGEENAAVYSDWARLSETTSKIRIHQKGIAKADDANAAKAPHFYAFSEIYTEFAKTTNTSSAVALHNKYAYDANHIVRKVAYNETLNLNSLDDVCDTYGNAVDYASYGLAFEHNLVEYNVLNQNQTSDATDQAKYARIKVDENGNDILSSCAANGDSISGQNRDAIGKTPVIQVVLKDTINNQVVDVRFYRILWTRVSSEVKTYKELTETFNWGCGDLYGSKILEAEVNTFYAWAGADGNGLDQTTFHAIYEFDTNLYGTAEGAKSSKAADIVGTVTDDWSASQSTQAHNITYAFNATEALTKSLYDGTDVTRMGYIAVKDRLYGDVAFIIPMKITIHYPGPKIAAQANYNQSAWNFQGGSSTAYSLDNITKYVSSNATLTTNVTYGTGAGFTDAQFINDLLNNYTINGAAPTAVKDLLVNIYKVTLTGTTKTEVPDSVKIIFDEDRLSILPGEAKWTLSPDKQTLYYKTVEAVKIIDNGTKVQLYEGGTPGKSGTPTEGALLLVNYTADETTDVNTIKNAVPVKLVGTQCTLDVDMDKYLVRFEKPLTTINNNVTLEVVDQITTTNIAGREEVGSVASPAISGLFGLKETFGQYRTVLGDGATPGLDTWYIVGTPNYDLANAKTNLQKDGSIGTACNTKITELKNSEGQQYWQIALIDCADGQKHFQFQNLHGNTLQQPVKIQFDVTIDTKWLKDIKYTVTVTVKPNTNPGGAK